MIAAVTKNGVIGVDGELPFDYPADMQHFKKMTLNSIVVMGRKTFEGIGRPLPKRENVVISKFGKELGQLNIPGIKAFSSIDKFLENEKLILRDSQKDIWFIGGASIYQEAMKHVNEIHLTITPDEELSKNAVRFPWVNPDIFTLYDMKQLVPDDDTLKYVIYKRK
jgi:dihydrofolate reductase